MTKEQIAEIVGVQKNYFDSHATLDVKSRIKA